MNNSMLAAVFVWLTSFYRRSSDISGTTRRLYRDVDIQRKASFGGSLADYFRADGEARSRMSRQCNKLKKRSVTDETTINYLKSELADIPYDEQIMNNAREVISERIGLFGPKEIDPIVIDEHGDLLEKKGDRLEYRVKGFDIKETFAGSAGADETYRTGDWHLINRSGAMYMLVGKKDTPIAEGHRLIKTDDGIFAPYGAGFVQYR